MILLRALLTFLPSLVAGVALVDLLWPARRPSDWLLKAFLGLGVGIGVTSCLEFFWLLLFGPASGAAIWLDAGLAVLLVAASAIRWRTSRLVVIRRSAIHKPSGPGFILAGLLLVIAALGLYTFWIAVQMRPNGNFDAYATWNLRARALFLSSPQAWTVAFSPLLSWKTHADYPLLWSMTILRTWKSLGTMYVQAGEVQTILFGLAGVGMMFSGLLRLRGLAQAALGAILLLAMPWFTYLNAFQQADGPLVFYYLAAIFLLLRYEEGRNAILLALAGLVAGLAAWTKNDGLMFLLGAFVYLLARYLRRPWGRSLGRLAPFLLGLALPLVTIIVFKVRLAPLGDLIGGQTLGQMLVKAVDPTRWGMILQAIGAALPALGGWIWPLVAAVPLYGLLAGRAPGVRGGWLWIVLAVTLLGYIGVYLITPHDLAWHLEYSLTRLLFHLIPPAIFLMLALIKNPGQIFGLDNNINHEVH